LRGKGSSDRDGRPGKKIQTLILSMPFRNVTQFIDIRIATPDSQIQLNFH
jgi:hypothetical protein